MYARENYQKILEASARLVGLIEARNPEEVQAQFQDNLVHFSPQAGADAVVVREGALLLIQRSDNELWALPGGLVNVGETLAEASCRELWEETGLRGDAVGLLAILDSRIWKSGTKVQLYHVVFQVEVEEGTPRPGPEALDVDFFPEEALPPLAPGHHLAVPLVFKLLRGEIPAPYFDRVEANEEE
jgi:ADP-ribose pyrophosphatase YjhB (NUDIX family)